jgi:NTP pyrophosphatase (non-canonical NTP hydrolase)
MLDDEELFELPLGVKRIVDASHGASMAAGWWDGSTPSENYLAVPARLMLIVSEIAEAMEADRTGAMDAKLPHRPGIEVELADAMIRIADLAGMLNLDLGGAVVEKLAYNAQRADHKRENRQKADGKKY